jgi:hypothetical protein
MPTVPEPTHWIADNSVLKADSTNATADGLIRVPSTMSVMTALVGLPYGYAQIPQTGI